MKSSDPDQWLRIFYSISNGKDHFETQIIENEIEFIFSLQTELSDLDISTEDFMSALRDVATNADANGDNLVSIDEFIDYLNADKKPSRPSSIVTIFNDVDGNEIAEDLERACDCRPLKLFTVVLTVLIFICGAIG